MISPCKPHLALRGLGRTWTAHAKTVQGTDRIKKMIHWTNIHLYSTQQTVVSVIWDPPLRKARAKRYSEKQETQCSCSVPSHFLTSACLLCHLCHSFAISWGWEFLSMTNQSCCFWLLHRYCGLHSLEITGCFNPLQWFQGYWQGKDICIQMKFLYSSVETLRFSEEIHGSFSEGNADWQGAYRLCWSLTTESLLLACKL